MRWEKIHVEFSGGKEVGESREGRGESREGSRMAGRGRKKG